MPSRPDLVRRVSAACALTAAAGLAALAWSSTLLGEYSVMTMGPAGALGRGHAGHDAEAGSGAAAGSTSVTELVADPLRKPDVRIRLVAGSQTIDVPGGHPFQGYTVNGTSPGPTIRARQGDLVEAVFVNESVGAGATLHWHGMDVPNAADGVAGITQDAVPVGGQHTYRFVAEDPGTYWYHSHQLSHEQVERGLLGAVVVEPAVPSPNGGSTEALALLHVYGGQHTLNGRALDEHVPAEPGSTVRIRVINTDQGTASVWSAAPFRVAAIDGREVKAPAVIQDRSVLVPAGGRVDITMQAPAHGAARLNVGGARSIFIGSMTGDEPGARQPSATLDFLAYGSPAPLGFEAASPDRTFDYTIGRRPGVIDGRPGNFWTINGRLYPDAPMFNVRQGDVVLMHLRNESGEVHPMHLHGHHVLVLSRDGIPAKGSPWWIDSLDIHPGESYDVAFVADNPGIWTDHCHTLEHAVDGLVAHVMYEGITTPFTINGRAGNHPE
ncbi:MULTISPECIES: multicopper oxidase family protein [unclassified Arthrobacter]|uniref:multicopper oxidase family protein n=1 Tax=unclassified Arthrobacter TaxID=235627 RepID=UPI001C84A4F0|nr:multicopper oxidase family protein [Arthrobacter sp. MAHUQ-56]MBX7445076.1 multicopper oxidase family protein [Arthrobacter sp. MAHUQ-56]